ncbi:hypothetical protein [Pseudomonas viridiflava]|uniref:hypothetical protein n=1 Tax=Pseudomonas viridiflava TaxID=33069 RepID=UPI000F038969|nr:hypothetical protein [Pseudomonas viridiflava]
MDATKPKAHPQRDIGIWKLLGAVLVTAGLAIGSAYVLEALDWIGPLQPKAWWMLSVVTLGLLFKLLFGDLATGEFKYYKHGYDLCVLTMGSAMASLCLQLQSELNLFPGLSARVSEDLALTISDGPISQVRVLLFLVFLASSFFALLTAKIARAIKDGNSRGNGALALINFCFGSAMLGGYVLILITKG